MTVPPRGTCRTALALTVAVSLAVAAGALLTSAPAQAMMRKLPIQQLTSSAATIVVAQADSVSSYRDLSGSDVPGYGGDILTDVGLRVCSVLKGSAGGELHITVPGGTVGAETISSPEAPSFLLGKTYLVFLDSAGQVVGWRAGQPVVSRGRVPALGMTMKQAGARIQLQTGMAPKTVAPLAPEAQASGASVATPSPTGTASPVSAGAASPRPSTAWSAQSSAGSNKQLTPVISAIDPPSAAAGIGQKISVMGSGFGTTAGRVSFYFDEENGTTVWIDGKVVSWSDTLIRVTVPIGYVGKDKYPGAAGSGPVVVTAADGAASAGFPFSVTFAYGGKQWPLDSCTYHVNATSTSIRSMVDAAAQTWDAVGSRFQLKDAGSTAVSKVVSDGSNDIFWASGLDANIIASTWIDSIGSAMLEADIQFNSSIKWGDGTNGTMDVQTIALHELGHWLNLRDIYGEGDSAKVMYGYGDNGQIRRVLTADDAAGMQWIYSAGRVDRRRPTSTQPRPATVRSGRKVDFRFRVNDPAFSCGAAEVTIRVRKAGKVVAKIGGWAAPTNGWASIPWKVSMKPGMYRWTVYARDLRGYTVVKPGTAVLRVR